VTSPSEVPSSLTDPTNGPDLATPSSQPTPAPTSTSTPTEESEAPQADAPNRGAGPGPLATTAPFTLRGAFVWGPLLMLSLLTMVLRTRKRPKRLH